jgi:hypothetical protein
MSETVGPRFNSLNKRMSSNTSSGGNSCASSTTNGDDVSSIAVSSFTFQLVGPIFIDFLVFVHDLFLFASYLYVHDLFTTTPSTTTSRLGSWTKGPAYIS